MLSMYTGTPGSGKSLHCAEVIYNALLRGRGVIANFDINLDVFKQLPKRKTKKLGTFLYMDSFKMSPRFFCEYALKNHKRNKKGHIVEGQTILVIDECQILFNARGWQAPDRVTWSTFFQQHRKYGYDVILITQFDRLIDRQIRCVIEYEVIHRNVSNYKTFGFILGLLSGGKLFIAITQYYCLHDKVDSRFFRLNKRFLRLYDSYKLFDEVGPAPERKQTADGVPFTAGTPSPSGGVLGDNELPQTS